MRSKSGPQPWAKQHAREIRRQTRKRYSSEEKIRIVLEELRGEYSIAELCRREGIAQGLHYKWSKEFLEAGKKRPKRLGQFARTMVRSPAVIRCVREKHGGLARPKDALTDLGSRCPKPHKLLPDTSRNVRQK
jgi:transposase-like protein